MKNIFLVIILLLFQTTMLMSQDSTPELIQLESGLQIKIHEQGTGAKPKTGDQITAHYTGKLLDGTVFDSSVQRGTPFSFEIGTGQVIRGWDEGFMQLHKGSKATFIIPAELAYGSRAVGSIPANSVLIFDVELIDIKPGLNIEPFDTNGKDTITTASGLQYIPVVQGKGKKAINDAKVEFHYSAYRNGGQLFDSTHKKGQTLSLLLGNKGLIPGLEEALMLMQEGDKFRVLVPPHLGLPKGNRSGVEGETLVFDLELVSVIDPVVIEPYSVDNRRLYNHESGLKYYIVEEGNGKRAKSGDYVEMHYTGYLEDGTIFDSSVKRGEVFSFKLGIGQVIKGWDAGVQLMNEGDKFRFILPADIAYGDRAVGSIPPNSTLIFDVELIRIIP